MPEQERCKYEQISIDHKFPIISVKGNELVFNPGYFDDPLFISLIGDIKTNNNLDLNKFKNALDRICTTCGKCRPWVDYKRQRLNRFNYSYDSENPNLFEIRQYDPDTKSKGRYVFIDDLDGESDAMAHYYCRAGFTCFAIQMIPHGNQSNKKEDMIFAQTVIDLKPDIVITDKGLGYFSGIKLITILRSLSDKIITVLVTGEWNTSETDQVAHFYIEKPYRVVENLNKILLPAG
jgi:hypothetical protein